MKWKEISYIYIDGKLSSQMPLDFQKPPVNALFDR